MGAKGTMIGQRPHLIPAVIAALTLFAALGDWSYSYYQLLRFIVCAAGAYVAYTAYYSRYPWAVWLFGVIAILFNPLVPIHLSRATWQPVDLMCAVLFLLAATVAKDKQPPTV